MSSFERGDERIEIAIVDRRVVTRTYRNGALVDERSETASSMLKAKWDADRLGQRLVDGGHTRLDHETLAPSHQDLVAAVAADPNDLDAYLVYADWLSERGEPWGQLMAIQHAIATLPRRTDSKRRAELEREETKLLFEHGARLWGPLGSTIVNEATQTYASDLLGATWHCGFVRSVSIDLRATAIEGLIAQLAKLEVMRLVEAISIEFDGRSELLHDLGTERWPHVRQLALETVSVGEGPSIDARLIVPLVDGVVMPKLVDLTVVDSSSTDALCEALAASPLAGHLRTLVLTRGAFSEAGVAALARARFGSLERLGLSGVVPPGAAMTLRSAAKQVFVDDRGVVEEDW